MAASLDIQLLPVARYAGRDYPELLSLDAAEPPRRRARGRELDRLILYLAMAGNAPLPPGKQEELLADLRKLYFSTPGSVTAALRRVAEELNRVLLERNLHLAGSSRQGFGVLVLAAVRGENVTLAFCGPAVAYCLSASGVELFADPQAGGRGLGQEKATPISFFQTTLRSGDTLLLSAQPADDWSVETLAGLHGQGPESLRRRLFGSSVADVNAVLMQARPGKGTIHQPRPGKPLPAAPSATSHPRPVEPTHSQQAPLQTTAVPSEPARSLETGRDARVNAPEREPPRLPEVGTPAVSHAAEHLAPDAAMPVVTAQPDQTRQPEGDVGTRRRDRHMPDLIGPVRSSLAAVWASLAGVFGRLTGGIRRALVRILPEESLSGIPSSVMAFTAVATPLVIVAVAGMVYNRLGVDAQYSSLFDQATQMGRRAIEQTNVQNRQEDLRAALDLLDKAEFYEVNSETRALRLELRLHMDELDLVRRVDYQPAIIGGLPAGVQVKRIVTFEDDLYLLDEISGSVLRARLTGRGYELDSAFACGPNAGVSGIGPLVDISIWPLGYEPPGNLLAIDAAGTLIFCSNDDAPKIKSLPEPEDVPGWGRAQAIVLDQGDGYVLDLLSQGVWLYTILFNEPPDPFFNEAVPNVQNVVDMTVNRDELYLVHDDGKLTLCYYSDFAGVPTRCSMPSFIDRRPGRESMPLIPPSPFTQIQNTLPPDPSLFLLEPSTQAIFHFSLRNLTFQRQYMPDEGISAGNATAFAVDNIRRYLFLAVGNQVYYAVLP